MIKSSTTSAEMQADVLISGGGNGVNGVNGVVSDALPQGGDGREDTLHPDVKHAVDKIKAVFGSEYPEWCDASEKEKRAVERFVSTASLKGVLGVDWKANGLPTEWAEAVHRCGFIKAPSAMQQVRDDVGQPTSKTARGYYAPPVRTAERDAEIAAREAGVIRESVTREERDAWAMRSSLGFDLTVGKPAWLKHNARLDHLMDHRKEWDLQRDGWKQNLPAEFFGEGIRFVTGRTTPKGEKHPDGTPKLKKLPRMNGGKGSGVRLYGIDEISTPEHLAVEAEALTDEFKFVGLHMHGTGFVCLDIDGVLRSDATVLDGGALVAAVEKELGADDFRARMIRAAVNGAHWVERSVSRTGVHIWARAVSRVGTKSGTHDIEVYDHTMTDKPDGVRGFIALGERVVVRRGEGEDCEPADSLLDGQMLVDAVCLRYWADDMGGSKAVVGEALGTRISNGEVGVILPQGGDRRKEKDTLPPVTAPSNGFSIHNGPAHLGGTGASSGTPETASSNVIPFNIRNRPAHLGEFTPRSFGEHRAAGASVQKAMMREMQDTTLADSPFAEPLLLGRALEGAGLSGEEAVDVQRLIEAVRSAAAEAKKLIAVGQGGAVNPINTDHAWYAIKTWALLEGEMGVPWLQAFVHKSPNKQDGTPLNWFCDDGTVDKSLVCFSLCQDLVRLTLSPADVENQTPTEIDDKRRHVVKVVDNAVRCSGAWEWYLEKRGGNGETAGQRLQSDVQKVSAARVDYLKKAESEKAKQKLAVQQADAALLDDLHAKARAPWDGKALAAAKSNFSIPLEGANVWCHLSKGKRPLPLCTPENVGLLIMRYGCRVRWNEMRHSPEYENFGVDDGDHEAALNIVYMLAMRNGLQWKIDDVDRAFTAWAQSLKFHPAREWIGSKPWDGISRIEQLADSVTVAEGQRDNWLMYFMRWALGAVNALYSSTGGASKFMLVLQGKQSVGKTRWFRTLWGGQDICKDGVMLDVKNKDSMAETVSWFGVELGELEATYTTRQIAELKAFTTKLVDEWRSPYGRKVNKYPRRTAFIGTVNKDEPLADYTGNTRFATVTAEEIRVDHGVDVQQFWAEMLHIWNTGTPDEKRHWLTKEEEAAMEQQNAQYTAKSTLHDYIEYLFDWSDAGKAAMRKAEAIGDKRHFMHLAQIYKLLDEQGVRVDGQAQKNDMTAALDRLGAIRPKYALFKDGERGRGFYLPPRLLRMEINGKSLNA